MEQEIELLSRGEAPESVGTTQSDKDRFQTTCPGPADEPWVSFTKYDHFGLALSGGGIRSATFNLGLLQGLNRNRVLQYVDYLSTVSGGGYVGGFWTAWLHANKTKTGIFPTQTDQDVPSETPTGSCSDSKVLEMREGPEFRHLREFSRFLMPRLGFTQDETWSGLVTILAGLLPSLLATTSLVILLIYSWFGLNFLLVRREDYVFSAVLIMLLTGAIQGFCERSWRARGKGGGSVLDEDSSLILIIVTAFLAGFFWWLWRAKFAKDVSDHWLQAGLHEWPAQMNVVGGAFRFSFVMFGPAVAWSLAAVTVLAGRFFCSRFYRDKNAVLVTGMMDRCAYRYLAPAVAWAGAASLWEFSRWLHGAPIGGAAISSGPVVFGGLFLWLRDWLMAPIKETRGTRLLDRIAITLKPLTPQLLAAAAVLSFCVVWAAIVQRWGLQQTQTLRFLVWTSAGIILVTLWAFNPSRVGMHDFYRARIARCFLGAAKAPEAEKNRATTEQTGDDIMLRDLRAGQEVAENGNRNTHRPIHLVCCAANNLAGDSLSSLYRGCRSAVLSMNGVSLGNYTSELPELRFSSALTASAAAFNSQMGRVSMRLGPAVAIILSALNLRLGLWVPHPLNPVRQHFWFPGRFFFYEMFGFTKCDQEAKKLGDHNAKARDSNARGSDWLKSLLNCSNHLHLSDGSHFENLGLYELIRRHCRYIIVSDCSADPEIAFDDLANTLRCIREDFGVEIDLDVTPLCPTGTGNRSIQHAVVGIIHYDGLSGSDKGTILYFKPTLTGDEPPDVVQYQTRNRAFPHESTGDQFYDQAQWESYRRLGEHAANVVFRFLQTPSTNKANPVENLFLGATQYWHPAPPRQEEIFLQLTERFSSLEAEVRDHAPASLKHEFFPEVAASGLGKSAPAKEDEEVRVIYFVMLAAQVMEDAWVGCRLDTYWSHPLNRGWMTYFQRWASTPSFRRWWPIVRPIYSVGFADFVKERFNLRLKDAQARETEKDFQAAILEISKEVITPSQLMEGMACRQWMDRYGKPPLGNLNILEYRLKLESLPRDGKPCEANWIQVGFLLFEESPEKLATWQAAHLFVCPSLVGAGIVARFLDGLVVWFAQKGFTGLRVILAEQGRRADPASRQDRVLDINFYKSRGFVYESPDKDGELRKLFRNLAPSTKS